jgi:plastocyanin
LLPIIALALAVPTAAQAAAKKKTVYVGTPPASEKLFTKTGSDVNAFFPNSVRVHVGDSVSFAPAGFHTLDLPPAGQGPVGLFAPTGKKILGLSDEAGNPFWFDGQNELGFDPRLLRSSYGKTLVKTPAARIESGLPLGNNLKPVTVRFPKAGVYTYYCDLHPGMKGTVRVVSRRSPIPSARVEAARIKHQVASALAVAKTLASSVKPAANTVSMGADGKHNVHYFGFLPGNLTVPAGTTVRFAMPTNSTEVHTATFGPSGTDAASFDSSYVGKIAATLEQPVPDPKALYPSDVPGPPVALSPALHGNGFWSTGALDGIAASPLPQANTVTFSTPGIYTYVCLIHPFMKGRVTVTP